MIQKRKYEADKGLSYQTKKGLMFTIDVYQNIQLKGCGIHLIWKAFYQSIILSVYLPFIGQTAFFIESEKRVNKTYKTKQISFVVHGRRWILSINDKNYVF